MAAFWSEVLGRPVVDDWGGFVRLAQDETGTHLAFARVPETKNAKNRVHLDLSVDERVQAVLELLELGAAEIESRTADGHTWTVMADPEGNEFCVA
ncbi:MAG: catechol 2,3-dioxygenase-like lactoylglutathione lyase family enzyme [Candidatus Poriferisodalaceae bacterium]